MHSGVTAATSPGSVRPSAQSQGLAHQGVGDPARPYLQGGQQGGKVGQLLLERLLFLLVLAVQSRSRP